MEISLTQPLKKQAEVFDLGALPTSAWEEWKYTNLQPVIKKLALETHTQNIPDISDMTCVAQDLLPSQMPLAKTTLGQLVTESKKALYGFRVSQNEQIETPLILRHEGTEETYIPDWQYIELQENSALTIIEYFNNSKASWFNGLTQIKIAPNAKLTHIRLFTGDKSAVQTQTTHATIGKGAEYKQISLTTSGGLLRQETHIELQGEHSLVTIGGVVALGGKDHADNTILIEHQAENCKSNQIFKYVLNDESKGVFQGKVHVHKQAQKTDGFQRCNAILLSPTAVMNTKPELEIYADDVKCSHGTTTGELDETPLFYLRSRGLPEAEARRLLLQAFIGEVLELVDDENAREEMQERIFNALI